MERSEIVCSWIEVPSSWVSFANDFCCGWVPSQHKLNIIRIFTELGDFWNFFWTFQHRPSAQRWLAPGNAVQVEKGRSKRIRYIYNSFGTEKNFLAVAPRIEREHLGIFLPRR
jgi:hypothetical protein